MTRIPPAGHGSFYSLRSAGSYSQCVQSAENWTAPSRWPPPADGDERHPQLVSMSSSGRALRRASGCPWSFRRCISSMSIAIAGVFRVECRACPVTGCGIWPRPIIASVASVVISISNEAEAARAIGSLAGPVAAAASPGFSFRLAFSGCLLGGDAGLPVFVDDDLFFVAHRSTLSTILIRLPASTGDDAGFFRSAGAAAPLASAARPCFAAWCSTAAAMKPANSGCAAVGFDLNSG